MPSETASRNGLFWIDGRAVEAGHYGSYHEIRIGATLERLARLGARRVVEVGAHPWVMTAALVDDTRFEVCATISAEEVTQWPDEIPVSKRVLHLRTRSGREQSFPNYSANIERTLLDLPERPDTVLACEIVEHLVRAPHLLFLNANRWLAVGGKLLVSTPNGAQLSNPLRRRSPTASYRSHVYERHSYLFTGEGLVDLIGLCGFRVTACEYSNPYRLTGRQRIYRWFSRLPGRAVRELFNTTIVVIAEKQADVRRLERLPRVYHPSEDWEWVGPPQPGGASRS